MAVLSEESKMIARMVGEPMNNNGWMCPVCKSVYSPYMMECFRCNSKETLPSKDTLSLDANNRPIKLQNNTATDNYDIINTGLINCRHGFSTNSCIACNTLESTLNFGIIGERNGAR